MQVRLMQFAALSVMLVLACNATPPQLNELEASKIPGGIYQGMVEVTLSVSAGGSIIDVTTESVLSDVSFSNSGIPLDVASGQPERPERPGLEAAVDYGSYKAFEKTRSMVVSGDRVQVSYETTVTIDGIPLRGISNVIYTLQPDGSVLMTASSNVSSEFIPNVGIIGLSVEGTGSLAR